MATLPSLQGAPTVDSALPPTALRSHPLPGTSAEAPHPLRAAESASPQEAPPSPPPLPLRVTTDNAASSLLSTPLSTPPPPLQAITCCAPFASEASLNSSAAAADQNSKLILKAGIGVTRVDRNWKANTVPLPPLSLPPPLPLPVVIVTGKGTSAPLQLPSAARSPTLSSLRAATDNEPSQAPPPPPPLPVNTDSATSGAPPPPPLRRRKTRRAGKKKMIVVKLMEQESGSLASRVRDAIADAFRTPLGAFEALPDSLILQVARRLSLAERVQFASSSKSLGHILYNCKSLWRTIQFPSSLAGNLKDVQLKALLINCHGVSTTRSISLEGCTGLEGAGLAPLRYSKELEGVDLRIRKHHMGWRGPTGLNDELVSEILCTCIPSTSNSYAIDFESPIAADIAPALQNPHEKTLGERLRSVRDKIFFDPSSLAMIDFTVDKTWMIPQLTQGCLLNVGQTSTTPAALTQLEKGLQQIYYCLSSCNTKEKQNYCNIALDSGIVTVLEHVLVQVGLVPFGTQLHERVHDAAIQSFQISSQILEALCSNIKFERENVQEIYRIFPLVPLVLHTIKSKDLTPATEAIWTLGNLLTGFCKVDCKIGIQLVLATGAVEDIFGAIQYHHTDNQSSTFVTTALRAINILISNPNMACQANAIRAIRDCSGMVVLEQLYDPAAPASTIAGASITIATLVAEAQKHESSVVANARLETTEILRTGISIMIQKMEMLDDEILCTMLDSVGTLLSEAFDSEKVIAGIFHDNGGVALLNSLLQHKHAGIADKAALLFASNFVGTAWPTMDSSKLTQVQVRYQRLRSQSAHSTGRHSAPLQHLLDCTSENLIAHGEASRIPCHHCKKPICTKEDASSVLPGACCADCHEWSCSFGGNSSATQCVIINKCQGNCEQTFCTDCKDVRECDECHKNLCEGCNFVDKCDVCTKTLCDRCHAVIECDVCLRTLCDDCAIVDRCDDCGRSSCADCGPLSRCEECDACSCVKNGCRPIHNCDECGVEVCHDCSELIDPCPGGCCGGRYCSDCAPYYEKAVL